MRLFVLGATGHTGKEIVRQALARGHSVTAFVRSPDKLLPEHNLAIVAGDPRRADALAAAMSGHDAVLSALGPPPREALRPSTLVTDFMKATVDAMRTAGVQRLAVVSAAVLFPERGWYFAFFRWLLRHHAQDLRGMEQVLGQSALHWTIARPPRLVAAESPGFRALSGALPPGKRVMSFRAVAAFMLDAVERNAHLQEVVGLGPELPASHKLLATHSGAS
jgi:putative NADH-flavin reductase